MSKEKQFEVTVRGQYQGLSEGSGIPALRQYEETFTLPSQEAALSIICKHLLAPKLRKKYPDFIRFRTHELVNINLINYVPNKEVLQMSIDDMSLKDLNDFCILRQIMIDPFKHASKDIFAIRAMVQKAYTEKRMAVKEDQMSKSGADAKEADALRKINDLEPTSKDPLININEQKLTGNAKAAAADAIKEPLSTSPVDDSMDDAPLPEFESDEPKVDPNESFDL